MSVMDYPTAEHFYCWLDMQPVEDQSLIEDAIHILMRSDPGMYPGEYSWPEIRNRAQDDCDHDWDEEGQCRLCAFWKQVS